MLSQFKLPDDILANTALPLQGETKVCELPEHPVSGNDTFNYQFTGLNLKGNNMKVFNILSSTPKLVREASHEAANDQKRERLKKELSEAGLDYEDFIKFLNENQFNIADLPIPHNYLERALNTLLLGNSAHMQVLFSNGLSPNSLFKFSVVYKDERHGFLWYAMTIATRSSESAIRFLIKWGVNVFSFPDVRSNFRETVIERARKLRETAEARGTDGDIEKEIYDIILAAQNAIINKNKFEIYNDVNAQHRSMRKFFESENSNDLHVISRLLKSMISLDIDKFRKLVSSAGRIDYKDDLGMCLLHYIICHRLPLVFIDVLSTHADFKSMLEVRTRPGVSSLNIASSMGPDGFVYAKKLIRLGTSVNAISPHMNMSPLAFFVAAMNEELVQLCMDHGGDPYQIQPKYGTNLIHQVKNYIKIKKNVTDQAKGKKILAILQKEYVPASDYSDSIISAVGYMGIAMIISMGISGIVTILYSGCMLKARVAKQVRNLLGVDSRIIGCHPRSLRVLIFLPEDKFDATISRVVGQQDEKLPESTYSMRLGNNNFEPISSNEQRIHIDRNDFLKFFKQFVAAKIETINPSKKSEVIENLDGYTGIVIPLALYDNPKFDLREIVSDVARKLTETELEKKNRRTKNAGDEFVSKFKKYAKVNLVCNVNDNGNLNILWSSANTIFFNTEDIEYKIEKHRFVSLFKEVINLWLLPIMSELKPNENAQQCVDAMYRDNGLEVSPEIAKEFKAKIESLVPFLKQLKTNIIANAQYVETLPQTEDATVSNKKSGIEIKREKHEKKTPEQLMEEARKRKEDEKSKAESIRRNKKAETKEEKDERMAKVKMRKEATKAKQEADKAAKEAAVKAKSEKSDFEKSKQNEEKELQVRKMETRHHWLQDIFKQATANGIILHMCNAVPNRVDDSASSANETKTDDSTEQKSNPDADKFKAAFALQCNLLKLVGGLIQLQKTFLADFRYFEQASDPEKAVAQMEDSQQTREDLFNFRTAIAHLLNVFEVKEIFSEIGAITQALIATYTTSDLTNIDFVSTQFESLSHLFGFRKKDEMSLQQSFVLTETDLFKSTVTYFEYLKQQVKDDFESQGIGNFKRWVAKKMIPMMNLLWLKLPADNQKMKSTPFYSPVQPEESYQLQDDIDFSAATLMLSMMGELYSDECRRGIEGRPENQQLSEFLLRCKVIRNALCHWGINDTSETEITINGNNKIRKVFKFNAEFNSHDCCIQTVSPSPTRAGSVVTDEVLFNHYIKETLNLGRKINPNKWQGKLNTAYDLSDVTDGVKPAISKPVVALIRQ